jgi:hypothetical protein
MLLTTAQAPGTHGHWDSCTVAQDVCLCHTHNRLVACPSLRPYYHLPTAQLELYVLICPRLQYPADMAQFPGLQDGCVCIAAQPAWLHSSLGHGHVHAHM